MRWIAWPLLIDETLSYLRAVAGAVDIPVMLYNLPVATGVDLDPDTVGALARETGNIRYIKNTTVDMARSARLIHNHGDVISTFVGWDSLLLSALAEGAAGVMAGTANVVPAELVAVYDAVGAGNLGQAREAWARGGRRPLRRTQAHFERVTGYPERATAQGSGRPSAAERWTATATSSHRRCWSMCPTARSVPARRSSARSSP